MATPDPAVLEHLRALAGPDVPGVILRGHGPRGVEVRCGTGRGLVRSKLTRHLELAEDAGSVVVRFVADPGPEPDPHRVSVHPLRVLEYPLA